MTENEQYTVFEHLIKARIAATTEPLFTTGSTNLFQTFLGSLPLHRRQHYNCHCCRRFIERYGGLVTITPNGQTRSLLWDTYGVPSFFLFAANELKRVVEYAKITGVFLATEQVWGTPQTGIWTHLSGHYTNPYKPTLLSVEQVMAEKLEDYKMLTNAAADFDRSIRKDAVKFLEADALDNSEKTLGNAKWFRDLSDNDNLRWLAVATAPAGFCHIRSGMIGSLLEDIHAKYPASLIRDRWNKKMHPLAYRRPTVVKAGTIAAANKIVEQLDSAGALVRYTASMEDITHILWKPKPVGSGPFDHLLPTRTPLGGLFSGNAKKITFEKFYRDVLPKAEKIEFRPTSARDSFTGMVSGPKEPLLFQWDNPVSWYLYEGGSYASRWNLQSGRFVNVKGITTLPCHWTKVLPNHGEAMIFILEGAKDVNYVQGGSIFPTNLKSEYHSISSAMEAYSGNYRIQQRPDPVCGILMQKGLDWSYYVRVNSSAEYILDRWE